MRLKPCVRAPIVPASLQTSSKMSQNKTAKWTLLRKIPSFLVTFLHCIRFESLSISPMVFLFGFSRINKGKPISEQTRTPRFENENPLGKEKHTGTNSTKMKFLF